MVTTDGKVRKGNCGKGELEKLNFDEIMPQNEHVQTDKLYNVVEFDCKYMTHLYKLWNGCLMLHLTKDVCYKDRIRRKLCELLSFITVTATEILNPDYVNSSNYFIEVKEVN